MEKYLDERNAAYDKLAKRFLARKSILAHILKHTVAEFADSSLHDIERKYIEGDPTATINTVPLDDTLDIKGKHTESNSPLEGLVTFDIIFDAIAPSTLEPIKLIINIEPQKTTTSIDYKLMKRAVYYVARLISSQKEKEFHSDDYNGLKKVYSIWITMDVQNYRANSIQEYSLTEKVLHGTFHDELKNYDLLKIIILNLGTKKTSHKLLDLLHLLFMDLKLSDEKEKILHDEYDITLTRDMRKELTQMGGLMEPLLKVAAEQAAEKTAAETEKKTLLDNIRKAMKNWHLSATEVMNGLEISEEKQKELLPLI
ncbi:nuclease [Candidatus Saccharibacteria bacterium]|nr:nuclease [Candidatus Saccharibacteria bacterium]MBR3204204.1 nuclease [Candidatus Saccharibacteria bacterium]